MSKIQVFLPNQTEPSLHVPRTKADSLIRWGKHIWIGPNAILRIAGIQHQANPADNRWPLAELPGLRFVLRSRTMPILPSQQEFSL